jgi:hypothetical protein
MSLFLQKLERLDAEDARRTEEEEEEEEEGHPECVKSPSLEGTSMSMTMSVTMNGHDQHKRRYSRGSRVFRALCTQNLKGETPLIIAAR